MRPRGSGDGEQDERDQKPGTVPADGHDDGPAAGEADDSTGARETGRFRLAPMSNPGHRSGQPLFASLFLPGVASSIAEPALSAIARTVVLDAVPKLNVQALIPQVDFSAIFPKIEFPWTQQFTDFARRLRERLPPNWPDDIDLDAVVAIIQNDGLPLVWVPRADIVASLLKAPDRAVRIDVLLAHEQDIIADCRAALGGITHETLSSQHPLAVKALDAFAACHYEAAQALAVTVTETAVSHALGNYAQARQKAVFDPDRVTLWQLRVKAALAPIGPFYATWYPHSGTPAPEALSRHVTVHQADQQHYTRGNSAVAILLLTSVLCALQELAEETPGEPGA